MKIDENGNKHPECIADEVELRGGKKEQMERQWNRKAQREGWTRKPELMNMKPLKRAFYKKAQREGWVEKSDANVSESAQIRKKVFPYDKKH